MASEQTYSTNDLRSGSVEHKRFHENKHKWALGQATPSGRIADGSVRPVRPAVRSVASSVSPCRVRPFADPHHRLQSPMRRPTGKQIAIVDPSMSLPKMARKHDIINEQYSSGDSSADEDVEEASAAPEPDAEIAYSYDAARGPSHGSQVLSMALAKAVERFENHATDKLVKEEYEVLDNDGESVTSDKSRRTKATAATEEDDYEFI